MPSPSPSPMPPSPPPSPMGQGIRLRKGGSTKCLDLPGGNTKNGNFLWLWECNGGVAQSWQWNSQTGQLAYAADPSKCIDIPGHDAFDGQRLWVWDCSGLDNQKWGYNPSHSARSIYSAWDNHVKCVDVYWGDGSGMNTEVRLWDCNGYRNQRWYVEGTSETAVQPAFNISGLGHSSVMV